MPGFTNRGKYNILGQYFQNYDLSGNIPVNFYVALVTSAAAPIHSINTLNELTEITTGAGYTAGGFELTAVSGDFDNLTENDAGSAAYVQIKDVSWTAAGGSIPSAGDGARYAVLTDDNATLGSREIYAYWDLSSPRQVSDGQTLTLQDCELDFNET